MNVPDIKISWLILGFAIVGIFWGLWLKADEKDRQQIEEAVQEPQQQWVRRGAKLVDRETSEPFEGVYQQMFDGAKSLVEWEFTYIDGIRQGPATEYFPTPAKRVKARANYVDGKREGPYVTYYFNGMKESEGFTEGGHITGLITFFSPDGTVAYRDVYERSAPAGIPAITAVPELTRAPPPPHDETAVELIDPEPPGFLGPDGELFTGIQLGTFHGGAKAFEHRFIDGREDGLHQGWNPAGELEYEHPYLDRRRHGSWKTWGDGEALLSEEFFHHGRQVGVAKHRYPNGNPRLETQFVHGAEHGSRGEFSPAGQKIYELTYEHGVLVLEKEWRESGELAKEVATPMRAGESVSIDPSTEPITKLVEITGVPDDVVGQIRINFRYRLDTVREDTAPDAARPFTLTLLHDGEPQEFNELPGELGGGWKEQEWAVATTGAERLTLEVEALAGDLEIHLAGIAYIPDEVAE